MEKEKIVSIEDRIPKLKETRKKKANRRLIIYLSIFFILISTIIYLQSPSSQIKEINIIGNYAVPSDVIIELSSLSTETNMWAVYTKEIERKISEHPLIEEANVKRNLPQTMVIEVKEHRIVGYTKNDQHFHPVLENGVIIQQDELAIYGSAPLLSSFTEEQYLNRMITELKETPEPILQLISEIIWEPTEKNKYKIVLYMNDGFIVHATIRDFASKIKSYPSIVSQLEPDEKGIVHMDVGIYVEKMKK